MGERGTRCLPRPRTRDRTAASGIVRAASTRLLPRRLQDLWDDENVIAPLPLNVKKSSTGSALKQKAAEIAEAMSLQ